MTDLFLKFVTVSLAASWLVVAVILLRLLLKKAPKWIPCLLWAFVAVRLMFPFSIESAFSLIPNYISSGKMVSEWTDDYVGTIWIFHDNTEEYKDAVEAGRKPVLTENGGYYVVTGENQRSEPATIENTVAPVLSWIWIAGMIVLCLYTIASYLRLRGRMQTAILLRDNIYQSEHVTSPFVLGVIRPRIYLPFGMAESDMTHVIAHEEAHIKRLDHWIKPLGFFLLTLYWFNPLLWVAYILLCRDIELACDERVIKKLLPEERANYSQALLTCSAPRRVIAACPLAFGEVGVKERVVNILHYKKPAFWVIVVAVLSCIIIAVCFLTNPKTNSFTEYPFGHSYRVESIVYDAAYYNFAYTPETAPLYNLSQETMLSVLEDKSSDNWQSGGYFDEIQLTKDNFDDYFKIDEIWNGTSSGKLRRENAKAWCAVVEPDADESVFYYLMLQENGDVYLSYGYTYQKPQTYKNSIRWIFKLTRYDLLECHAVSDGFDYYLIPGYYPDGFDFKYDSLVYGDIKDSGNLIFDVDWDTDTLTVGEDYYTYEGTIGTVTRSTYELEREASGNFTLPVSRRNLENSEEAIYFVKGETGTYVFRILFPKDELPVKLPESKVPESVLSAAILEQNKLLLDEPIVEVESHIVFGEEEISGTPAIGSDEHTKLVTIYALVMTQAYKRDSGLDHGLESVAGSCIPTALTFSVDENNTYTLEEYWIPRDGDFYPADIREKFPEAFAVKALRAQDYVEQLQEEYQDKARKEIENMSTVTETPANLSDSEH